jgi:hypothetical protein
MKGETMTKKWLVGILSAPVANPLFSTPSIYLADGDVQFDNQSAAQAEAARRHAAKPFITYATWPADGVWPPVEILPGSLS